MRFEFFPLSILSSHWIKEAAAGKNSSLKICQDIMQTIYRERPDFWPHGLSVEGHDGGLYLLKDASDHPVGFTGWQVRNVGGKRVGYYTIGILPEHRGKGMAKAAVMDLIRRKRATVDAVRACIVPSNSDSMRLARSLGVPVDLLF